MQLELNFLHLKSFGFRFASIQTYLIEFKFHEKKKKMKFGAQGIEYMCITFITHNYDVEKRKLIQKGQISISFQTTFKIKILFNRMKQLMNSKPYTNFDIQLSLELNCS
jgi:hypothetical protein